MEARNTLFSYKKYGAHAFGPAPFLPMSRAEMETLGWDSCDIIIVTGDAYVDHPSFGMAIVGRLLEAQGFRVGIAAQRIQSAKPFRVGKPNLFFGVTGGNMDSMVNRYTADRRLRHNDSYTPGGVGGKRPDRSVLVYAQRCREAYPNVPIVLGGIESSLRRIAHYDYWSDKVRRSVLVDAKADILLYGNAERAAVEVAHRIANGEAAAEIDDVRGTAVMKRSVPEGWTELAADDIENADEGARMLRNSQACVRLPSFEQVQADPEAYARASRVLHRESNPGNARTLVQRHAERELWVTPPPIPLTTAEMDGVYELPYARGPHRLTDRKNPPGDDKFSVRSCAVASALRFCSITEHEPYHSNRSEDSVLKRSRRSRQDAGFTGVISDISGSGDMYRLACRIRRLSGLPPSATPGDLGLNTSTAPVGLYPKRASCRASKRSIASGVRYDLAVTSPLREELHPHVGSYLKIAPEHGEGPLSK
jgi:uncharacterized radical SAM protein YgiQ